jgi:ribose 5-phosphate isomerase A
MNQAELKEKVGSYASNLVKDGQIVGMGTGSTVAMFAKALKKRRENGEEFLAIPTSYQAIRLCKENSIPMTTLDEHDPDVAFDGADEVDPNKCLIKGRGGAHVQEKIVDYAAKEFYVLVDKTKIVEYLGTTFPIPIEVVPMGLGSVTRTLEKLGTPQLREAIAKDGPVISDNGNLIIDLKTKVTDPYEMESLLNNIPGVVGNGIFTRPCKAIIAYDDVIDVK